jgi:hypothetical protein
MEKDRITQVTRDIDPASAQDLLERAPRACLSFAGEDGPQILQVGLRWQDDRFLVSIPGDAGPLPVSGQEVVLLVDEGIYYFDLRAIYIRGQALPVEFPPGASAGRTWLEGIPLKTVAWDYGKMREVENER